jgi:hypothetical protein
MRNWSFARYASIALGVGLLAGCSAAGTQSSLPGGASVAPQAHHLSLSKLFALTNAHHVVPQSKGRVGHSWMKQLPKGKGGSMLAYMSDDAYDTVDVFSYPSGSLVGQVAGFEDPAGLCTDKKGNVYATDLDTGTVSEIGAGGTTIVNTWSTSGEAIGCSVDKKGDLAVSDFYNDTAETGAVVIFAGGGSKGTTVAAPGYVWGPGFDKKGDIYVECAYGNSPCSSPAAIYLKKGGNSFSAVSGLTIGFGAQVEAMGNKAMGFGDQEPGGQYAFGIYAAKVKGANAKVSSTNIYTDNCNGSYTDVVDWGNVMSGKKVTAVVGGNLFCDPSPVNTWNFPGNGLPSSSFTGLPDGYYGYGTAITQ